MVIVCVCGIVVFLIKSILPLLDLISTLSQRTIQCKSHASTVKPDCWTGSESTIVDNSATTSQRSVSFIALHQDPLQVLTDSGGGLTPTDIVFSSTYTLRTPTFPALGPKRLSSTVRFELDQTPLCLLEIGGSNRFLAGYRSIWA